MFLRILLICSFVTSFHTFSQSSGSLSGAVYLDSIPLEGVVIKLVSLNKEYKTGDSGEYRFENISEGKHELIVKRPGIKTDTLKFTIHKGENKIKNIHLSLAVTFFDEIEVVSKETGLTQRTPYNIRKLDAKNLSFKGSASGVMGLLQEEPGVNAADMGHGISKPFIRGLGFSRVVTIYQGNKLENHQWGADHGLGLSDLGISSIDVIKGPASILYGSGALGGVIILNDDESYLDSNGVTGNIGATFNSVSLGVRTYASVGKQFDNGFFMAFDGAIENHADYFDGNNRLIGNSRFNTQTTRLHAGIERKNFFGKLSYSYNDQNLGIIDENEMNSSLATFRGDREMQLPFQRVTDHVISYRQEYSITKNWRTELSLSHHFNKREEIEEDFNEIDLGLEQHHSFYNLRITYKGMNLFTHAFGLQGSGVDMRNNESAKEILIPNARYFENGAYYLGTFSKNNHTLQGGIRFDYRTIQADGGQENIIEQGYILPGNPEDRMLKRDISGFTGSVGYTYKLKRFNLFKFNLSSGYRAPDLAELFSNGNHPGTNRFERGNADFGREQSLQADVSWLYKSDRLQIELSSFANFVSDYLFFVDSGDTTEQGLNIWEFIQRDVVLFGGEFNTTYRFTDSDKLLATLNGSFIRGQEAETGDPITFIPADRISFKLNYKPWERYDFSMFSKVNKIFDQNRPGFNEQATPGYVLLDAGLKYIFQMNNQELALALTVNNVLNRTYVDHIAILRTFNINHPGINCMVNVQWRF